MFFLVFLAVNFDHRLWSYLQTLFVQNARLLIVDSGHLATKVNIQNYNNILCVFSALVRVFTNLIIQINSVLFLQK